jgi:cytochrome c oxidase assembly protein subunit 15
MTYLLPLFATVAIGVQIVMGGIVVGKDAGFACPDWPLCNGQILPPRMTGLLWIELGHRFSALLVVVLVAASTVAVWRKWRDQRGMKVLSLLAALSLLVQVLVAGLIVLLKLPGVVTTIDVLNSMTMLSLYVGLTLLWWRQERIQRGETATIDPELAQLAKPAWMMLAALALAIAVGAVFRHTGASEALFGQNSYLLSHGQTVPPSMTFSITWLALHSVTGMLAALAVGWFTMLAWRVQKGRRLALTILVLTLVEIILGVIALLTQLNFWWATAHWGVVALLCALCAWNAIRAQLASNAVTADRRVQQASNMA